jgi:hypothetical protein
MGSVLSWASVEECKEKLILWAQLTDMMLLIDAFLGTPVI